MNLEGGQISYVYIGAQFYGAGGQLVEYQNLMIKMVKRWTKIKFMDDVGINRFIHN